MSCRPFFDCQLDYARLGTTGYLPDTCEIYEPLDRSTATRTSEGDIDDTYPTNWTLTGTVSCLVRLPRLNAQVYDVGAPLTIDRPVILLDSSTVITSSARIKITASLNSQLVGKSFDVLAAPLDTVNMQRVISAQIVD